MLPPDTTSLFEHPDITCQQVIDFLLVYVDGSISASDKAAFDDHLAQCPSCVAYLDGYRKMIAMTSDSASPAAVVPSAELPSQILKAVGKLLRKDGQEPH